MSETPDVGPELGKTPYQPPSSANPYQGYQPHQSPYGVGPTGIPFGPPPDHPKTATVLVLGILGIVLCQVLAPFAWVIGNRTVREIDASGGRFGGRSTANAGRICGIVGSVILAFYVALVALLIVVAIASPDSFDDDDDDYDYYGLASAVACASAW